MPLSGDFELQGKRWIVLFTVCTVIFSDSLTFFTFGEINSECIEVFYDFNGAITGEYLSMVYIISNIFGSMWAVSYIYNVKLSFLVGGLLNISGVMLKFCSVIPSKDRYDPILWGQVLCGLGLPFSLNTIATVAHHWFSSRERDWALKYMYMAHPVGVCFGLLLGSYFGTHACSQQGFIKLFGIQEGLLVLSTLMTQCLPECPPTCPSNSSEIVQKSNQRHKAKVKDRSEEGISESAVQRKLLRMQTNWLLKSPNIWTLAFCFASAYALIYSIFLATAEHSLALNYGYSLEDTLVFIAAFATGGLLGTYVYGACIAYGSHHPDRGVYHPIRTAGFVLSLLAVTGFNMWLDGESSKDGMVAYFILGVLLLPLIPVCLESGAELSFDVPEGIASSFFFIVGNIVLLASYVLVIHLDNNEQFSVHNELKPPYKLVLLILSLSCCLFSLASTGPYKRSKAEHLKKGPSASPRPDRG